VGLLPAIPRVSELQEQLNEEALRVIEEGAERCPEEVARVNAASAEVNSLVQAAAAEVLARGAIPAVLGGDHSSPYGLIAALCAHHGEIGVLHIDAHADLRPGYLGFAHSHAAIFHNALQLPGLTRHVGVGWRDVGRAEIARVQAEGGRVRPYFDRDLARAVHEEGRRWSDLCDEIIEHLPPLVYVSFDIDGLEPTLCPHTGTPVPGGLSFREASALLARLSQRRRIVGFDLCEVAPGPDEWDANVGARVLYKLAGAAIRSQA
jgi:agmatinase